MPLVAVDLGRSAEADEGAQVNLDRGSVVGLGHDLADRQAELFRRGRGSVGLEDAGLGLHDLPKRPEREAVSVR